MGKRKSTKSNLWTKIAVVSLLLGAGYFIWHQHQLYVNNGFHIPIVENRPESFNTFGIDISHHQGEIDWETVLIKNELDSIISFVYFKVSEGVNHKDTRWDQHRKMLQNYNKQAGAYHFFLPKKDALEQAKNFLDNYEYKSGDLAPVLDVELEGQSNDQLIANMKIWLKEVERKTKVKPIIYTSLHFYQSKFQKEFLNHKFWIASYSRMPDLKNDERIIIWQYSEKGNLPGFDGAVDLNVSRRF